MAGAAIAAIVVGTTVSAYGTMKQGQNANMIAKRNAEIMERNATTAQQNAEFNAKLQERDDRRRRSQQQASLQSSGMEIYDGTNLIGFASQEWSDEINAELIRRGGANTAANLRMQAGVTAAEGQAAQSGAMLSAGGSLLTGFGSAPSAYTG
jgi:hypothetical protein